MSKLPEFVGSGEICDSLGFTKRTLQRRFYDKENPLPRPCIERIGAESLWEVSIARAWIEREREIQRTRRNQFTDDIGGCHG